MKCLIALLALPLGGCISAGLAYNAAYTSIANSALSANDHQFVAACTRYAGVRDEFTPDLSAGIRLYYLDPNPARCGSLCQAYLNEGYAFVEVSNQVDWQGESAQSYIVRFEEAGTLGEFVKAPAAAVEAISVESRRSVSSLERPLHDFNYSGMRVIDLGSRRNGRLYGSFEGIRRVADGAVIGTGEFALHGAQTHISDSDTVIARCPIQISED